MSKRAAPKMPYFPVDNSSTHWKQWMILMMSDPRDFYSNSKWAVIGTYFHPSVWSENTKAHQPVSRIEIEVLPIFAYGSKAQALD